MNSLLRNYPNDILIFMRDYKMNDGQFYAENIKSEEVNVLFFHNTLPEYRIG